MPRVNFVVSNIMECVTRHANRIQKLVKTLLFSPLCSYLFPDGRSYNPDLTGLCEPTPHDHIKVTQVGLCVSETCLMSPQWSQNAYGCYKKKNIPPCCREIHFYKKKKEEDFILEVFSNCRCELVVLAQKHPLKTEIVKKSTIFEMNIWYSMSVFYWHDLVCIFSVFFLQSLSSIFFGRADIS